jgi:hypothetical protein
LADDARNFFDDCHDLVSVLFADFLDNLVVIDPGRFDFDFYLVF